MKAGYWGVLLLFVCLGPRAVGSSEECGPFFLELNGVRADASRPLSDEHLDIFFGPLAEAKLVKDWERTPQGGVVENPTRRVLDPTQKDQRLPELDPEKLYNFIVDAKGRLVVGEELVVGSKPSETLGHPTLVDGAPGRIAGELYFRDGRWKINQKSLRYSMAEPGRKRPQLEMVGRLFRRFGLEVEVDFLDYLDF